MPWTRHCRRYPGAVKARTCTVSAASRRAFVEMNVERDTPFPFQDGRFPASLGAVVQRTVASGERPALVVIHDDENDWIVQDGVTDPTGPGGSIIQHIAHVVE